jgi:hypothetical protein
MLVKKLLITTLVIFAGSILFLVLIWPKVVGRNQVISSTYVEQQIRPGMTIEDACRSLGIAEMPTQRAMSHRSNVEFFADVTSPGWGSFLWPQWHIWLDLDGSQRVVSGHAYTFCGIDESYRELRLNSQ